MLISGIGARSNFTDRIAYTALKDFIMGALAERVDALAAAVASGTAAISEADRLKLVPTGSILMWSGASNALPAGWIMCDGSNNTPDLRGRFVIGAAGSYGVNASGGNTSKTSPIAVNNGGAGTFTMNATTDSATANIALNTTTYSSYAGGGSQAAIAAGKNGTPPSLSDGGHSHTMNGTITAGDHSHGTSVPDPDKLLPPYFALCYIMKT